MSFWDRFTEAAAGSPQPAVTADIADEEGIVRYRLIFSGQVQGVGFRYTMQMYAGQLGLTGWAHNHYDGSVVSEVQGEVKKIRLLIYQIQESRFIRVSHIQADRIATDPREGSFRIK